MLVYNAIKCLNCGDVLWSKHRHDYVVCSCGKCMNDGGIDYRRSFVGQPEEDLSVKSDEPFEKVRQFLYRYNKHSADYVKLKDISDRWLQNIINYYISFYTSFSGLGNHVFFQKYLEEKLYRAENEIYIEEDDNYMID